MTTANFTNKFDQMLELFPEKARGPFVEVLDTAYAVSIWMECHNVTDAIALVGLTKLVLKEMRRIEHKEALERAAHPDGLCLREELALIKARRANSR